MRGVVLVALIVVASLACSGGASAAGASGHIIVSLGRETGTDRNPGYPVYHLWTLNPDGSGLRRLKPFRTGLSEFSPAWSPAGTMIAFSRNCDEIDIGGAEIWTMHADGSNPVRLTAHCGGADSPAWSPDGSTIAYANIGIWRMNADGSGAVELTNPPQGVDDSSPDFSPDGRTILFVRTDQRSKRPRASIWEMNADGSNLVRLTRSSGTLIWDARFSPDGKTIAVAADTLEFLDPDGSLRSKTKLRTFITELSWSPNGRAIACACGQLRQYGVWIYNLTRRRAKRIFRTPPNTDGIQGIDWSR